MLELRTLVRLGDRDIGRIGKSIFQKLDELIRDIGGNELAALRQMPGEIAATGTDLEAGGAEVRRREVIEPCLVVRGLGVTRQSDV